jgi:hypothetical protein
MSNTNKELATGLRNCSVDSKSRRVDWQEALGENMEGWQAFEIEECEECERSFLASSHCGQAEHRYVEPEVTRTITGDDGEEFEDEVENECMGTVNYFEGPMMNFFHPCELRGLSNEEAAEAIAHLPLCVVEFEDGERGFALTGGGMDLSWEICDAYISCGYLPPFDSCDLPDMSGKEKHPRTQLILAACQRTAEILEGWAERRGDSLAKMAARYKKSAA